MKILCKTSEETELVNFMKELEEIDEDLVTQILLNDNELVSNSKIVSKIIDSIRNEKTKQMTYKLYIRNQVKNLNNLFK